MRTAIHQDADGAAWFSVDQPSTRFGSVVSTHDGALEPEMVERLW